MGSGGGHALIIIIIISSSSSSSSQAHTRASDMASASTSIARASRPFSGGAPQQQARAHNTPPAALVVSDHRTNKGKRAGAAQLRPASPPSHPHLVHPDLRHVQHLCHAVHGRQAEPPRVLLLCQVQQRDEGAGLVVGGVAGNDLGDLGGERGWVVGGVVCVCVWVGGWWGVGGVGVWGGGGEAAGSRGVQAGRREADGVRGRAATGSCRGGCCLKQRPVCLQQQPCSSSNNEHTHEGPASARHQTTSACTPLASSTVPPTTVFALPTSPSIAAPPPPARQPLPSAHMPCATPTALLPKMWHTSFFNAPSTSPSTPNLRTHSRP